MLKNLFKRISTNTFFRNVAILSSGTVISQIILLATSPFLARLFSVEEFGILSIFTSVSVFLAVVSTGRYELAVGLPDTDEKSATLVSLIIYISVAVSLLYLIGIVILHFVFHWQDPAGFLDIQESLYAPLYIFFAAISSALLYWNQRFKNYKKITLANALQVVSTSILGLLFGYYHLSGGLIWALISGIVISGFYLLFTDRKLLELLKKPTEIKNIAKKYISFPKYMMISDLSLVASQQFLPILFATLYSTTIVGFFAMANRMIRLPNIVITTSIGNVFRNDAIDEIKLKGDCRNLYLSTFKKLVYMSIPVYLFIFITAPFLFKLVFGAQWEMSGEFARILCLVLFLEFIATPLNTIFYVRDRQKILMRLQFLNAAFGALAVYIGYFIFDNVYYSLIFYSINSFLFNAILLYLSFKISIVRE